MGVRVASMKTLNTFAQLVVLVSLPLLLGGCGEKKEKSAKVKAAAEAKEAFIACKNLAEVTFL